MRVDLSGDLAAQGFALDIRGEASEGSVGFLNWPKSLGQLDLTEFLEVRPQNEELVDQGHLPKNAGTNFLIFKREGVTLLLKARQRGGIPSGNRYRAPVIVIQLG